MKKIFLFSVLITALSTAFAQNRCGTMSHLQSLIQQDPKITVRMQQIEQQTSQFVANWQNNSSNRAVITIPVVVHVVYNTTAQNISDAQIQSQIDRLNLDYHKLNTDWTSTPSTWQSLVADFGIQFCLASRDPNGNATTGIVRTSTTVTSFIDDDKVKYTSSGGDNAWPSGSYLNLWVCNLGNSLLGYAQFPGGPTATDGVVITYTGFGSTGTATAPYNLGRTATHEIGHWLNLYHIWGDDNGACSGSDQVNDTPNQASEHYGCPTYPATDACATSSPGTMFMNYMDYTNDACMYMFTNGQYARSSALFASGGSRYSLLSSQGCAGTSTAPVANFTGTPTSVCLGQSVQFTSSSTGTITSYSWSFTGGTPATSTAQNPSVVYNTPGTYTVSLTVTGPNGTNTKTQTNYITVASANALPLQEGFESTTFPPTGWTIQNGDGATTWARTTSASGFGTSTAAAYIDLYNYQTVGQQDWLITPAYSFTGVSNGRIKWDYAYANYNQAGSEDTLTVYYSTNCGTTWSLLWKKGGSQLATATSTANAFVPTAAQWKKDSVSLSSLNGQASVKFAFVSTNKYGNNIFLDNVNIYNASGNQGSAPVADFVGTPTTVVVGNTVSFTDLSTNSPASWSWSFAGGTPATSTTQNPVITYNTVGTYTVSLTATNTNGSNTATKTNYITVIQGGAQTCDTMSNFVTGDTLSFYYLTSPGWGYLAGHNSYGDLAKAELFTNSTSMPITGALLGFGHAHAAGSSDSIVVKVWDATGAGGSPGNVLASQKVLISSIATDIVNQRFTSITFTSPPTVTANFYVGFAMTYVAGDTVGLYTTTETSPVPNNGWEQQTNGTWYPYSDGTNSWGVNMDNAIFPISCTGSANGPTASFTANNTAVCAGSTVSFTSTSTGSPTSYSWTFTGGTPANSTAQNPTITYSTAGTYAVALTVSNANGNNTSTQNSYITVYSKPGLTMSSTPVLCFGGSTGSATVTATGGTPAYTYHWNSGGSTATISNQPSGTYTVTVTDSHQCSSTASTNISQSLSALTATMSAVNATCGLQNGSATVTATGGAGNYTYQWSNSATTSTITGLGTGTYNVTVYDNNQCSATASISVSSSSSSFVVTLNVTNATCGQNNGAIAVAGFGNQSGTTYSWNNGGNSGFISSLAAGHYTVTVTHSDGCSASAAGDVVSSGSSLNVAFSITPSACSASTGAASANVSGGTGPYTYHWSTGATTAGITNVAAGGYTLTATDNTGCTTSSVANVSNNGAPTVIITPTSPTCHGSTNGSTLASASGGSAPYTYNWSSGSNTSTAVGLAAGTYVVSVHDNAQCVAVQSVTLTDPSALLATVNTTNSKCGNNNGTATVIASGGTGSYTYHWNNNATTGTASNLMAGTYTVTVYDVNQCSVTSNGSLGNIAGPSSIITPVNGTCSSAPHISTTTVGGTSPYTYNWSNGSVAQNIQNLSAGAYSVTITDANGCTNTLSTTVTEFSGISVTYTTQNPTPGNSDGSVTTTVSGGTTPYTYNWSNGGTTATISGLAAGTYTVTITDNSGCVKVSSVTLGNGNAVAQITDIVSIKVFPNPAANVCQVQIELNKAQPLEMQLFNTIGQEVWGKHLAMFTQGLENIDVSSLSAGVYLLKIQVKESAQTLRVIKQ
jgi:PKD repeat protein